MKKQNVLILLSLFSIAFLNFATLQLFFDLYRALPTSLSPMVSILKLRAGSPQSKKKLSCVLFVLLACAEVWLLFNGILALVY